MNFAGDKLGTPGCNSGFYVHVGALKTYNSIQDQTDGDFLRSYIGTAAALYNVAWNFALEQKNRNQQPASSLMNMLTAIALFSTLAVAIGVPSYFLYTRKRRGHDK